MSTNMIDAGHLKAFIERVREMLEYDPLSGDLYWKNVTTNRVKVGDRAGNYSQGYVETSIDGRTYRATHLIWVIVFGRLPHGFVDHINGVRDDNRLINLREATHAENARNVAMHRDNTCGAKGVQIHRGRRKPYQARIYVDGRQKSLGYFATVDAAKAAYDAAAKQCFGKFARVS